MSVAVVLVAACDSDSGPGTGPGPQPGDSVTFDFSRCIAAQQPVWFAYQDGDGAWQRVTGAGHVYHFEVRADRAGVARARVFPDGRASVFVEYYRASELAAAGAAPCFDVTVGKTVSGTATGFNDDDIFLLFSLGGSGTTTAATPQTSTFEIAFVPPGSHDLVAYRYRDPFLGNDEGLSDDRMIIRRDQDIPDGGSLDLIDFENAEAFVPDSSQVAVTGAQPGDGVRSSVDYLTGAACSRASMWFTANTQWPTPVPIAVVPPSRQRSSDFHAVTILAGSPDTTRVVTTSFHAPIGPTVTLGPLVAPIVEALPGAYRRAEATVTIPAEYRSHVALALIQDSPVRGTQVTATRAWVNGSQATLAVPNFSGVAGWDDAWGLSNSAEVRWQVFLTNELPGTAARCVEGARSSSVTVEGPL